MRGSSTKFRISKGWWTNNNFHCNGQESNVRKVGNLFQQKKHIEMQKTSPKQENNIISKAQQLANQPYLHQFYTIFRTTHEHIFYITVFGISYRFHICQISSNTFRDLGILSKTKSMLYTHRQRLRQTDLGWQPHIDL